MLTVLLLLAFAVTALVLIVLVLVVFGIQSEPPETELGSRARNPIAAIVRHLLGVYVTRPDSIETGTDRQPGACLARSASSHNQGR